MTMSREQSEAIVVFTFFAMTLIALLAWAAGPSW